MSDAKSPPDLSIDEILATIRRIISEDEHAGAPSTAIRAASGPDGGPAADKAADEAADKAADSDDVLELTEAINKDGSTRHLPPIGGSFRQASGIREPPPLALRPEPGPEPGPRRREAPSLRLAPRQAATVDERLVADAAASAALNRLSVAPRRDGAVPLGARTLEDIVGDLLRPLLRTWLDENLPPIVERLVQAEIVRVAREAGSA